jgi:hypothetical protein
VGLILGDGHCLGQNDGILSLLVNFALTRGRGSKAWRERRTSDHRASSSDNLGCFFNSFLTILFASLSPGVLREALESDNTGMIVAYHPPIFKPLKFLTLSNPLQNSLLQCAAAGISVYSPHTALDCVRGGINDWLAYGVLGYNVADVRSCLWQSSPAINVLGEPKGEGAGLGRVVKVDDTNLSIGVLAARIKKFLNLEYGSWLNIARRNLFFDGP